MIVKVFGPCCQPAQTWARYGRRKCHDVTGADGHRAVLPCFGPQPTIQAMAARTTRRAGRPARVLMVRAQRAARFALAFAVHRQDTDADAIRLAAYLHDFAEMLMWCHAPTLMQQVAQAQQMDPSLRSSAAQRQFLNMEIDDLRQNLMKLWHLPSCWCAFVTTTTPTTPACAVWCWPCGWRATPPGLGEPAIPDDIDAIAELLNVVPRAAIELLHKVDQAAAGSGALFSAPSG